VTHANETELSQPVTAKAALESDVSLIRGGPFYRAQEMIRLIDAGRWNLGKRIVIAIAVGWVPLILITAIVKPHAVLGLLGDYPIAARVLIAVPVLLAGQLVMESVFRKIVRHIGDAGLLSLPAVPRLDEILVRLLRLRDSFIPEVLIVLLAFVRVSTVVRGDMAFALPWAVTGTGSAIHLSIAGWYYELFSQFLFLFLLGISLWKWLLWTAFLFRLSRLDLRLYATHPDKHGGLGFIGMSPTAIAPTVFVSAAAIGATWRVEILREGMHLMDFKIYAIVLLMIVLMIAFGPLIFFVPRLSRLRRQGILDYGALGQIHSADFHRRWIEHRAGHEEEFITAPDSSSLIDFASSFENVEDLKPFPFDKGAFIAVILAIAIPMLPVVLAEIPLAEVLKGLLSALK
jgi:hypothetical protein